MKKLIYGVLFVAAMGLSFGSTVANAQGMGGPGAGNEDDRWICCQEDTTKTCTDMLGNGHYGTVKRTKCLP
ncbi:hypothetical protein [Algoriphagus namhaensis]